MTNVNVVDAVMGVGKTTTMFALMNNMHGKALWAQTPTELPRFMFVTPFLAQTDRLVEECPVLDFAQPERGIAGGSKLAHLMMLLREGRNIATTHSLFTRLPAEARKLISEQGYRLVIDEAVDAVNCLEVSKGQMAWMRDVPIIKVDDLTGAVQWLVPDGYESRFDDIRERCQNGTLFHTGGGVFVWTFPINSLKAFREVWVLTYLFENSTMAALMRAEGISYRKLTVDPQAQEFVLFDAVDEAEMKAEFRRRIRLYEGPLNRIGDRRPKGSRRAVEKFTARWLSKSMTEDEAVVIRNAVNTFMRHKAAARSSEFLWTVTEQARNRERLTHRDYGNPANFLPINARATNDFVSRRAMAYLGNRRLPPPVAKYLREAIGQMIDEDLWALSEMLQWLWRGCIRRSEGGMMDVFIPAERMRQLFAAWLDSDTYGELEEAIDALRCPVSLAA